MSRPPLSRGEYWILAICLIGGALLTVIGIRYLLVPRSAAFTFGLADPPAGFELHYLVGLRNVWLGLLAIGFAVLRQWRALALWFGLGALVCFADAAIAANSSGELPQVAFHAGSGIACLALTIFILRIARRET
jgi:uncharacterized protein DUF4267